MSSMRHECASVSELMTLVSPLCVSLRLTASHCVSLRLFVLSLSAADLAALFTFLLMLLRCICACMLCLCFGVESPLWCWG